MTDDAERRALANKIEFDQDFTWDDLPDEDFNAILHALRTPLPATVGIDEVVTRVYRRFKDWSQRGFGPDDVTWCEVKADLIEICAATSTPPLPATASREAEHVKDICKRLREGGRHSGIIDPLNTDAANLIEVLYLAALAPVQSATREALNDIARQHTTDEMCEDEIDGEDFENAYDIIINRARTALSSVPADERGVRWRHKTRCSIVTEVARGFAQVSHHPIEEMTAVVIYRHDADGKYWVRNAVEFDDGRFEELPSADERGEPPPPPECKP